MTQLSTVPRWALDQVWKPAGRRGPKRERTYTTGRSFDHSRPCGPLAPWRQDKTSGLWVIPPSGQQPAPPKAGVFKLPESNLSQNEMRYWYGSPLQYSNWRACRCCETVCLSAEQLKAHKASQPYDTRTNNTCFKLLDLAYKLLLREKKCVVCGTHTLWDKWGVPLCKHTSCVTSWLFTAKPMPDALEDKLLQASLMGGAD